MTHGRRSSLYRSQTSTLFNAFESDEDSMRHEHVGLHQLREDDEYDEDHDEEDEDADEMTRLRTVPERQVDPRRSGSRSHSNSPHPPRSPNRQSLGDVRLTPRQV